jgi:hypothetical protein
VIDDALATVDKFINATDAGIASMREQLDNLRLIPFIDSVQAFFDNAKARAREHAKTIADGAAAGSSAAGIGAGNAIADGTTRPRLNRRCTTAADRFVNRLNADAASQW